MRHYRKTWDVTRFRTTRGRVGFEIETQGTQDRDVYGRDDWIMFSWWFAVHARAVVPRWNGFRHLEIGLA